MFSSCGTAHCGRVHSGDGAARGFSTSNAGGCAAAQARLTLFPLPDQLLDRARQRRLEVDQLRPGRGHDDPDHAVVERTHLRLPLDPLLGGHLVGGVRLEVLVRDAIDVVQLGPSADEQDLGRVHLGVDRQGNRRVVAQGRELRGVLRGAHDDLRAVPGERDRDVAGCAVLGDVGQAGHVAGQQLLADRSVQNLGDLVRLHGYSSLVTVDADRCGWSQVGATGRQLSCSASATMIPSGPRT